AVDQRLLVHGVGSTETSSDVRIKKKCCTIALLVQVFVPTYNFCTDFCITCAFYLALARRSMQTQTSLIPLPQADRLQSLRQRVDERLVTLLPDPESALDSVALAMHQGTLVRGKRLRPLLLLAALADLGYRTDLALDP